MNIIETQKKGISSLYVLKALCAFFVVVIHFSSRYGYYLYPIIRTAVPCFFMISGYFLYSDNRENMMSKLIKAFRKTLTITIFAYLFYFIVRIVISSILKEDDMNFHMTSLLGYIIAGPSIWGTGHLWYLVAYLETLLITLFLVWSRSLKLVWILIPLGLIVNMIVGVYGFILPLPSDLNIDDIFRVMLSRNFFTIGIPAFSIGLIIRKYNQVIIQFVSKQYIWIIFVLLMLLSMIEFIALFRFYSSALPGDALISTTPLAACAVIICLHYKDFGSNSIFETIGKKYSTDIYIYHMFVRLVIVKIVVALLNRVSGYNYEFMYSAIVIFFATLIFVIIWQKSISYAKNILHIKSAKI